VRLLAACSLGRAGHLGPLRPWLAESAVEVEGQQPDVRA
jgi:hypothetical protein